MESKWLIIVSTVCFTILLTGWFFSRRLPESEKNKLFRKFSVVAVIVFLGYFVLINPTIISFSYLSSQKYEYPKDLATTEAVAKQTQQNHYRLEDLEEEVKRLREELYQSHRHYGVLLIFIFTGLTSYLINSAFYSKKNDSQNDEV